MKLRDCIFLLPANELEGFPRSLPNDQANCLLSGWIGLWHPRLLAAAASPPRWQPADRLPAELHDILFVLPEISESILGAEAEARIHAAGGRLLRPHQFEGRSQATGRVLWRDFQDHALQVSQAAGFFEPRDQPADDDLVSSPPNELTERLAADFAALGFVYLQIQLMTRQLRYTSNLDVSQFGQQLIDAARSALCGDRERALQHLQACFDALGQERDHYYSLDVHLLDVTLLAPTTLGKSLLGQLVASENPNLNYPVTSYLASGTLLQTLRHDQPAALVQLQAAVRDRRACVTGGLLEERPHPLMTREAFARDLARGRQAYLECGLEPPKVFARHSFGLNPESVSMLKRWDFEGCFLIAWAQGAYPDGSQPKISWEAPDGTYLASLATRLLDASDANSFLSLGWTIGEALDHQHVPTILFAHWPNKACEFAALLQIIAQRTPALGRWQLADEYFEKTDQPYHQERLSASSFRHNWLSAAASASDLLHATKAFHILHVRCRSLQNLLNLAWQLEQFHQLGGTIAAVAEQAPPATSDPASQATQTGNDASSYRALAPAQWSREFSELTELTDRMFDNPQQYLELHAAAMLSADRLTELVMSRLLKQLVPPGPNTQPAGAPVQVVGRLIVNPRSFPTRVQTTTMPNQHFATDKNWNFANGRVGQQRVTCVDVPASGFVTAPLHTLEHAATPKQSTLADAGGMINNEFLEIQIDNARGHLRSLHVPAKRGNRLSLLIARRDLLNPSDPSKRSASKAEYSDMVATDVKMLTSSNVCGVIRATGRLEFSGKHVAQFEIDYQTWRGSRVVDVHVRLHDLAELASANPWHSAYVLRLAWPTDAAILRSYASGSRQQWPSGERCVAPNLIEIDEVDYRTHYLTGGLAFHRRTEERFLETILASRGDREVYHRIGLGVDLPYPTHSAGQFLDRSYEQTILTGSPLKPATGWMASVDTKSVTVDFEYPLVDAAGKLVGVRLFVCEIDGKSTNAKIRLMREIDTAARVDYLGGRIGKLTTSSDCITIALRSSEQVNVDVLWKQASD